MKACIVSRSQPGYSETFIRTHFNRLPVETCGLWGGPLLVMDETGGIATLMGFRWVSRALSALIRLDEGCLVQQFWKRMPGKWHDRALARYLKRMKTDVVLAEYGTNGVSILNACLLANIPLVVHFHGIDASSHEVLENYKKDYRKMFQECAGIIAVSKAMQEKLISLGAPEEKITLIHYGIDVQSFSEAKPGEAPPEFLAVGRFVPKKAPHLTILAFQKVLKACPEAKLTMVGDGALLDACRILVDALGMNEAVTLAGVLPPEKVQQLMRNSRAFVQHSVVAPSGDSEGTPVAVMEASMSGLPVVSTRHAGIPDVVEHERTGFLVEEKDIEGMAHYMIRLAKEPSLAGRLGKAAREKAVKEFSVEKSIGKLHQVLENAVQKVKQ
jgi:colanic acid/amylovoran biosynthesis glycosyltransferase